MNAYVLLLAADANLSTGKGSVIATVPNLIRVAHEPQMSELRLLIWHMISRWQLTEYL